MPSHAQVPRQDQGSVSVGLLAGASTGVFWGVPFLAPQVLRGYSSFEIAFGRFFFFGIMGLVFLPRLLRMLRAFAPIEVLKVLVLSASGFWLYSSLLFWSIQRTDGVISSLVLGLLPITIPVFTPGRRSGGGLFYSGLAFIGAGLGVLVLYPSLSRSGSLRPGNPLGVAGLIVCLLMWTFYAIANSRFLRNRKELSSRDFSSLMGVLSLACLLPVVWVSSNAAEWVARPGFGMFVLISAVLGWGSSWLANWLWNFSAKHIPSEVSGLLLVFETIFGLFYTFLYEHRLPHVFEAVSIGLSLGGVVLAVIAQVSAPDLESGSTPV